MKKQPLLGALTVAGLLFSWSTARAQATQQASPARAAAKQEQKPAPKPHKVWTNDDIGSVGSPADIYADEKEVQAAAATAKPSVAAKQSAAAGPPVRFAPPALATPKSVEDADKMIAWEDRDIEAQQEFVDRLQKELDEAPADQIERLEKLLEERRQILADTRKERQALLDQKKELEKKSAEGNKTRAPSQPPSQ